MKLEEWLLGSIEKVAVLGDSLVKTSDLLIKQTAQLLEFLKVTKKDAPKKEDMNLSDEDRMTISEALKQ